MADGPQCASIDIDFSSLADLCTLMPRRLLVTGILIQWLRIHFTEAHNITDSLLQDALWTSDIETTGIVIDSVFRFNAAQTEYLPGIFVKPGAWKIERRGIDDRKMMGSGCSNGVTGCTPTEHISFCQGSHTIFCVAGESAEVEILANDVYHELIEFGPIARREFNFLRFVGSDIGEPAILEEATENFVVPITVSYYVQDVWGLCPPICQDQLNEFGIGLYEILKEIKERKE